MDSEAKVNRPGVPGYLSREAKVNPVPQLRNLIFKKIKHIHFYNDAGIKLLDDQIMHTFDTVLDQRLQSEVVDDIKRFKKGCSLSREGIEYKKAIESEYWEQNPTLKLADLIIVKTAGMDALSDEELEKLDRLIQDTHKESRAIKKQRSDWLMEQYFTVGRKLTTMAVDWLEDAPIELGSRQNIRIFIEEERQAIEVGTKAT